MPCPHLSVAEFHNRFCAGLRLSLEHWSREPGSLTIARNGGAELAIRGAILGLIEQETNCFAITEAAGERADVGLYCSHADCGRLHALLEFKHNLVHRRQIPYIAAAKQDAPQQLTDAMTELREECKSYYIHVMFELISGAGSVLADLHNAATVTAYKRFQPEAELEQVRPTVQAIMASAPSMSRDVIGGISDRSHATLLCWAFEVDALGNLESVPL